MEIRSLDDWPFAVRCLITFGQTLANERVHAETTGAHVLNGLMAMPIVRTKLGPASCDEIDKACNKAVLVSRRGGATTATLSQPLSLLLFGTPQTPSTAPRTTASFLSGFLRGSMFLEKAAAELGTHAEAIAAQLDDPRVATMLSTAESAEVKAACAPLHIALLFASEMQHQYLNARHVVYAGLSILDAALQQSGKEGLKETVEKTKALLERSIPKRGPKSNALILHPRLIGALAHAVANAETPKHLAPTLVATCIVGDAELEPIVEAFEAGTARLRS